jgi:drug/metabolite transporter (DMT)-like permease
MLSRRQNLGLLLGFVGIVIFAGTMPGTRFANQSVDPYFLTALRALLAGIAGLVTVVVNRRPLPPKDTIGPLILCSVCVVLGFPLLMAVALVTVPAGHSGVILGVLPLATAIAAALIQHERPSKGFWIAGVLGAAIVISFAVYRSGGGAITTGDLLTLLAVPCAAVGYTYSARLTSTMPGWEVISWIVIIALPVALLAMILTWPADIATIPASAWLAIAYLGLMSQFIGFFAWNAGLAMGGVARVSQIQLLMPFVVVLMAAAVNREAIDLETVLFAAAVVATVAIGTRMRVTRTDKPSEYPASSTAATMRSAERSRSAPPRYTSG